jgi:hypothetical protein
LQDPISTNDWAQWSSWLYKETQIENDNPVQPRRKVKPYLKNNQHRVGGIAQVTEYLLSQVQSLDFNPSTLKQNKQTKRIRKIENP